MRRITPKGRIDTLTSEPRLRRPGRSGRIIYLVLLAAFFVYVFDLVFGSMFYLSANGMLMRESSILSPDYTGTVAEIATREGDEVTEGAQLLRLDSLDVTAQIATSTIALGRLQSDLMERIERRETVAALIPEAESRRVMLLQAMEDVARLRSEGLAAATRESDAVNEYYAADRDLAVLLQEQVQLDREIPQVGAFVTEANDALADLQDSYDEGRIIAPISGTIGELSVDLGEVVERGSPLLRVFHGAPYVMAYVPPGRLFDMQPGQRVSVRAGFVQLGGEIETVYPIAPALPPEFSLAFDSTQRQQLIKITLDGQPPQSMPLFSTVRVTGPWNPVSRTMALINRVIGEG